MEALPRVSGPNTGRNSRGRRIIEKIENYKCVHITNFNTINVQLYGINPGRFVYLEDVTCNLADCVIMKHTINYVFTKINLPISCDKLSRVFLCLNIIFNLVQI